jgi:hypothetical protein
VKDRKRMLRIVLDIYHHLYTFHNRGRERMFRDDLLMEIGIGLRIDVDKTIAGCYDRENESEFIRILFGGAAARLEKPLKLVAFFIQEHQRWWPERKVTEGSLQEILKDYIPKRFEGNSNLVEINPWFVGIENYLSNHEIVLHKRSLASIWKRVREMLEDEYGIIDKHGSRPTQRDIVSKFIYDEESPVRNFIVAVQDARFLAYALRRNLSADNARYLFGSYIYRAYKVQNDYIERSRSKWLREHMNTPEAECRKPTPPYPDTDHIDDFILLEYDDPFRKAKRDLLVECSGYLFDCVDLNNLKRFRYELNELQAD